MQRHRDVQAWPQQLLRPPVRNVLFSYDMPDRYCAVVIVVQRATYVADERRPHVR